MRLRNTVTGVVVSVSEEKAARLGQEWQPAEKPAKAPRGRGTRSSDASTGEE